jgi:hypothetical protein
MPDEKADATTPAAITSNYELWICFDLGRRRCVRGARASTRCEEGRDLRRDFCVVEVCRSAVMRLPTIPMTKRSWVSMKKPGPR